MLESQLVVGFHQSRACFMVQMFGSDKTSALLY
jgi:hypothetical protein